MLTSRVAASRQRFAYQKPFSGIPMVHGLTTFALTLLRQGRSDEARGDMLVGAALEAQQPRRYAIGAALERVQGGERLLLEGFRRNAHREAVVQASATTTLPPMASPPRTFARTPPSLMAAIGRAA